MVTSDPVRARMAALTRSMSDATRPTRGSIDAPEGLSKGTITATRVSNLAILGTDNRKCQMWRQGLDAAGVPKGRALSLRELVRTNDIVLVSAVGALLDGARIHHVVLDQNMSIIEGSLGILPRRILVHDEDVSEARQILADAGLSHELRPDE